MEKILDVKEGLVGNLSAVVFLLSLCGFTLWWGFVKDPEYILAFLVICIIWLFGCYVCIGNIVQPKRAFLAIVEDQLIWSVRQKESEPAEEKSVPLSSLEAIEIVLPKILFEVNPKNYFLAEVHLVDVHGYRYYLPTELMPGVYREKIVAELKAARPDLKVIERIADDLIKRRA